MEFWQEGVSTEKKKKVSNLPRSVNTDLPHRPEDTLFKN